MRFEELIEFDTELTADVVEWQPNRMDDDDDDDEREESLLACGTYYLNKELSKRLGRLYLLKYDHLKNQLNQLDRIEFASSGILDMKWLDQHVLVTIDSANQLNLFSIDNDNKIQNVSAFKIDPNESTIGLTLDFMKQSTSAAYSILSSDDKGHLTLTRLDSQQFNVECRFPAHDYETWSVLIDRQDANTLYSGADDSQLRVWDLRSTSSHVQRCSLFDGGVCSILPTRSDPNHLLCSSYDERIYLLDKRNMKRSVKQSSKLHGGVWKMKMHESRDQLLCACMHYGVHIVDANELTSLLYYNGHELNSLAYGCDWMPKTTKSDASSDIVATCSFYNHNLRIWKCFHD